MTIDQLGLGPYAKDAALTLRREFGEVIHFRRGYRDLDGQAWDMSGNVVRNKEWIRQTYTRKDRPSYAVACALQEVVYQNAGLKDRMEVYAYLREALQTIPNAEAISFHIKTFMGRPAAEAFDMDPLEHPDGRLTDVGQAVNARIRTLPALDAFLKREGGLRVWHLQFMPKTVTKEI